MKPEFLILNIAANLERLSRFAISGDTKRVEQFFKQTDDYLKKLKKLPIKHNFLSTLKRFENELELLRIGDKKTYEWADRALTWANILTHRAKLA